jgi:GTP cyclohydrolase II
MQQIQQRIQSCLQEAPHRANGNRPYVTLSYAQSVDGSIAFRPGKPLALSCKESLVFTHWLRSVHDGILVGIGTILADNPGLTVRHVEGRSPQPIIVDGRLRFPLDAQVLQHHHHIPWIATSETSDMARERMILETGVKVMRIPSRVDGLIDLQVLLHRLKDMNITSIMVEGGAEIITSFLKDRLVDQLVLTISPMYIGGMHAVWPLQLNLLDLPILQNIEWEPCGADIVLRADIMWNHE